MPVTPFHLGPGLLFKASARRWFSLGTFALVQFVIDIEAVGNILLGRYPVHDRLHTVGGALLAAGVCAVLGKSPVTRLNAWASERWGQSALRPSSQEMAALTDPDRRWEGPLRAEFVPVTRASAAIGALVGALTHIFLDALMHADVEPLAPWVEGNPIWLPGSFEWLHGACAVAALLAVGVWIVAVRRADMARNRVRELH